jgi:hypothetical protein
VPVPLRPLRLLDVLDGAFAIVKLAPRTVLALTAVLVLPIQLLAAAATRGGLGESADVSTVTTLGDAFSQTGFSWANLVLVYVTVLPLPFLGAALARLLAAWYGGHVLGLRELLRGLVAGAPALLGVFALVHLAETIAAIPCGLPLPFLMPLFLVAGPVVGVEGLGAIDTLRRSWELARRRYWACFWVVVCSGLVAGVLQTSFSTLPSLLALLLGDDWGWVLIALGNIAAALVVAPFVCGAAALAYLDLRVRTEGLDLEIRAVEVLGRAGE